MNPGLLSDTKRPVAFTLLACAVIYSCTLTYPFNNDNALYAYMGELLLHGGLPYIGSWDQNFPAIVVVHAVQILLFGHSQLAFHIFDVLLQLSGSYLLIKLGTALHSLRAGVLASLLAALYYVQQGFWMAGERDTYVSIILLAAICLALQKRNPLVIGILCGIIVLFRPTYGLFGPLFLALEYWQSRRIANSLRLTLGAILPVAVVFVVYACAGGLEDLYQATLQFNFQIYSHTGIAFGFWEPVKFYWLSILGASFGAAYLWQRRRVDLLLLIGLFLAALISLIVLYRHSVYHYHPAMTLFLLLSAIGWASLSEKAGTWFRPLRYLLPAVVLIFFFFQTFRGNTVQHVLTGMLAGKLRTFDAVYNSYEPSATYGANVQEAVASYLRNHTKAGDIVQMFGPYSYPQYAARLLTASRFQTLHAITMRDQDGALQPFQKKWREEYLQDMITKRPVYFIVCDAPEAFRQYYGGRLGHEILQYDFTAMDSILAEHYSPETKIGAFTLYRLRN